jgi:acetylornithine deacetylase/succinyl-diaminopimelate desuccinylase-like protein
MDRVEIFPTAGHPIVYAEKRAAPGAPVILVYGHYDVQPPDPLDLWESGPFEPVIKPTELHPDGAIFARGACDDKGQVYMHVKAFEILSALGPLPCTVKFLIEGEEEVGSKHLEGFVREHKELLQADIILVSDTSMVANDVPSVTVGLRGLSYVEVEVQGPSRDLHSGVYGGAVDNPINALCEMIASLKDENGQVTIPGFYDAVVELSREEREALAKRPFDREAYLASIGIRDTRGEAGYSILERASIRPTLDVNGIWGGYTGEGAKTVLPAKAFAKISMRLVPDQDPDAITALFAAHFQKLAPPSVSVTVRPHHGGSPAVISTENAGYRAAARAMAQAFGKEAIPTREGGSIPIVALFQRVLGLDTVLMGFGLDSDAIHSPNEHYGVFNYLKGIETIPLFHHEFAALQAAGS